MAASNGARSDTQHVGLPGCGALQGHSYQIECASASGRLTTSAARAPSKATVPTASQTGPNDPPVRPGYGGLSAGRALYHALSSNRPSSTWRRPDAFPTAARARDELWPMPPRGVAAVNCRPAGPTRQIDCLDVGATAAWLAAPAPQRDAALTVTTWWPCKFPWGKRWAIARRNGGSRPSVRELLSQRPLCPCPFPHATLATPPPYRHDRAAQDSTSNHHMWAKHRRCRLRRGHSLCRRLHEQPCTKQRRRHCRRRYLPPNEFLSPPIDHFRGAKGDATHSATLELIRAHPWCKIACSSIGGPYRKTNEGEDGAAPPDTPCMTVSTWPDGPATRSGPVCAPRVRAAALANENCRDPEDRYQGGPPATTASPLVIAALGTCGRPVHAPSEGQTSCGEPHHHAGAPAGHRHRSDPLAAIPWHTRGRVEGWAPAATIASRGRQPRGRRGD